MFSYKTPQIAVDLDYTILQQVCTVSTVHYNNVDIMHGKIIISTKIKNKLRSIVAQTVQKLKNNEAQPKFTLSFSVQLSNTPHFMTILF